MNRRYPLLFLLSLLGTLIAAQTAPGNLVEDFNFKDIKGKSHRLYDYLNAGKMVVIDVSATWCGPCWSYHKSGDLNEFYRQHGPESVANDAMVFFIEGDPTTTSADLDGSGSRTLGNWVTGQEMPIIDLTDNMATEFAKTGMQIGGFPTMYVICPNRSILRSGHAGSIGSLFALNFYMGKCPAPATSAVDPAFLAYTGDTVSCDSFDLRVVMQNNCTEPLTSTSFVVEGLPEPRSYQWNGNLNMYDTTSVLVARVPLYLTDTARIRISGSDSNPANSTIEQPLQFVGVLPPIPPNNSIDFADPGFPYTDWQLYNPDAGKTWEHSTLLAGMLVLKNYFYRGAPGAEDHFVTRAFSVDGQSSPTLRFKVAYRLWGSFSEELRVGVSTSCVGPFTEIYTKTKDELVTGPALNLPYTPATMDEFREECIDLGAFVGTAPLYFRFTNKTQSVQHLYIDDIAVSDSACGIVSTAEREMAASAKLYPNPASDQIIISASETFSNQQYTLYDSRGTIIRTGLVGTAQTSVDVSELLPGMYTIRIVGAESPALRFVKQ